MVEIACDVSQGLLLMTVRGEMFPDTVELLKMKLCRWSPEMKKWTAPIMDMEYLEGELISSGEDVEISELTRMEVRKYAESLREMIFSPSRIKVCFDKMNFPPLEGKHPYEQFQKQDISRALNQNRFLFNWEMGLGKSYALACLLTSLREYHMAYKCLILSTGVGVYNLKDELLKFCKDLKGEEIFPISSVRNLEDRDIFNKKKFPHYSVIIMTYDTFTEINNFYYDMAHVSKRTFSSIEKKEENLKELVKKERARLKKKGERDFSSMALELPRVKKEREAIALLKEKLHPSRKVKYEKSSIPMGEWLDGHEGILCLDECHSLANPKSRRSEVLQLSLSSFYYRYEFTGTLADKYEKLYQPLAILDPYLVKGKKYQDWLNEYNDVGTRWSRYAVNPNGWRMEQIHKLNELMLREYASKRKMTDCLDLPLNYSVPTIQLDMSDEHRWIYEEFIKESVRLKKEAQVNGGNPRDDLLKMFQVFTMACDNIECIISNPSMEKFSPELQEAIRKYKYTRDNRKLEAMDAILQERVDEEGERGIIWYQHPRTKDSLIPYLKKYNPMVIQAGMSNEELNEQLKEFKNNPSHKVLIASINVMNTSVTLTECKFSIYLERTYSYQVWSQSKGRIWRPSQTSVTRVYTMSYRNSIDNLQLSNLTYKGEVVNSLLSKKSLTQQTWKKIFNFNLGDKI